MYFFYIDESGTRDPKTTKTKKDGTTTSLDHVYVLTAVSLFEYKWRNFESEITNLKLELIKKLNKSKGLKFTLADCEVKSTWLRIAKEREKNSLFLKELSSSELRQLSELYFAQLKSRHMHVFSVVIDKRKMYDYYDHHKLHKKAYELLLERIENYLSEFHPKHQGLIVIDDTDKSINRELSLKHAYFQREGNQRVDFKHIVEYPFFTNSKLSNGIQLADIIGYNVYRAFKDTNFSYPYFQRQLPYFYFSRNTADAKLDGLKVFPDDSELVEFVRSEWGEYKTKQPTLFGWAADVKG